jgi:hypothetical protein
VLGWQQSKFEVGKTQERHPHQRQFFFPWPVYRHHCFSLVRLSLLMRKIKSLSNTKGVYLASNQEICENKIIIIIVTTISTLTILLSTAVIILATLTSKKITKIQKKHPTSSADSTQNLQYDCHAHYYSF